MCSVLEIRVRVGTARGPDPQRLVGWGWERRRWSVGRAVTVRWERALVFVPIVDRAAVSTPNFRSPVIDTTSGNNQSQGDDYNLELGSNMLQAQDGQYMRLT